jgi:SAM-dependent methyltransferase
MGSPEESRGAEVELVEAHRRVWERKPFLRATYARYHDMILARCPKEARTLELACGLGHLSDAARARGHERWLATDLLAVRHASLRCDALALPFGAGSLERIVFIDMLHHLSAPKRFFREAARVLAPGGEVVAVEPWVTLLSYPVWRFFHQEGCDLSRDIEAPFADGGAKRAYEGDGGLTTLVCTRISREEWRVLGFEAVVVEPFNDMAYLSTRGFREGRDAPGLVYRALRSTFDRALSPLAPWLGVRALIRWVRAGQAPPAKL